ncbi:DUF2188 domain-containing protein [Alkalihalobacillus clausii]|uniref:DUF2188 domain-containing protein n=1 Tax=Shouchella clausii TaxID=79880 RepID=UPI000BA6B78F|nr:DUF2188 domain-containing protein [Shouchella clausii]MCM3549384.1 DUF2188 domain-containing protein [Shouchella clausii]PAF14142.1 hypothetical protein CHH59_10350 [Shouchella clausii]
MPWTMDDYPSSLKNFDKAVRKKAIEMANSMVKDGYSESRAIPIATEQAKKWKENADENEVAHFLKHGKVTPSKHDSSSSSKKIADKPEHVVKREDGWAVYAEGAKRASYVANTKEEALQRARKIAKNKGAGVKIDD